MTQYTDAFELDIKILVSQHRDCAASFRVGGYRSNISTVAVKRQNSRDDDSQMVSRVHSVHYYYLSYNTPNANMADHSVGARDESHESEVSQALMFCFDNAFPEKSCFVVDLVTLFRPLYPFLCS